MRMLLWLLIALIVTAPCDAATILLKDNTDSLEIVTSTAAAVDYTASFVDHTSTTFVPGSVAGQITTATTTTIVPTAALAAGTSRQLKELTIRNASTTTSNTVTLQRDVAGANRTIFSRTMGPGEAWDMDANGTITPYDATGRVIAMVPDPSGVAGQVFPIQKTGSAKDAAGYWYSTWKDAGIPGTYVLGTPGLNGYTTNCATGSNATNPVGASQAGAHVLPNPASGSLYLAQVTLADGVAETVQLIDVVWYNTGAVVTTTTAQAITMPTLPNRDLNGSNAGDGWQAALYTTTAATNAAAISNTSISYTNQDGTAGKTGTFTNVVGWQAPATPVLGTWMPFQLAAGDRGIRSIQSLTLGTSYVTGALSLVLYRVLATLPVSTANVGSSSVYPFPGVKLWPGTCVVGLQVGSASAGNLSGSYVVVER